MNKHQRHKQVPVKVMAYVDKGIKELVEALNSFDKVSTFESCQGGKGKSAFVYMDYGIQGSFKEVSAFAHRLATILANIAKQGTGISPEPIYDIHIAVEWWGDKEHPFISIEMPSDSIEKVTNIFYDVRKAYSYGK
jgi:hypothetical protein